MGEQTSTEPQPQKQDQKGLGHKDHSPLALWVKGLAQRSLSTSGVFQGPLLPVFWARFRGS